jgi:subtilisin family serine protease
VGFRTRWRGALAAGCALLIAPVLGSLLTGPAGAADGDRPPPDRPASVTAPERAGSLIPGRYLVVLGKEQERAAVERAARAQNGILRASFRRVLPAFVAELSPHAAAVLERDPRVARLEPDRVVTAQETQRPAVPGLDRIDQRQLPLSGGYEYTSDGTGVTAYVVDTGIRRTNADFGGRVTRAAFDAFGGDGEDCNGHGTHVAGTIGGTTYGVAKAVQLVPVRVLNCDGSGSVSGIVAGLDWVLQHRAPGAPALVNMSLGGASRSTSLDLAVERVTASGLLVVAAAGNSGSDACQVSPAGVPVAVTVAAVDATNDTRPSFSNTGTCVDLFAPGVRVLSTWHTADSATATISGTSMAAPHVAGAVALVLQRAPGATPAQITQRLLAQATTGVVQGGSTSPNLLLFAADVAPQGPPAPVTDLTVTPGPGTASLSWTPPAGAGNVTVSVRAAAGATSPATPTAGTAVPSTSTSATETGLAGGTDYAFSVFAVDDEGRTAAPATTQLLGTQLSASPSSSAVTSGADVTVRGTLTQRTSGATVAAQPVQLLVRQRGTTAWSVATTTTSSSTGVVSATHRPSSNADYALRFAGGGTLLGSTSGVTAVDVRQAVSGAFNRTSAPLGTTVYLSGTVSPSHARQPVVLQRLVSGAWQNVTSGTLSSNSTYRFPVRPGSRGTYTYRVSRAADADHAAGLSASRSLSVT